MPISGVDFEKGESVQKLFMEEKTMKDINSKQADDTTTAQTSTEFVADFNASSCEQPEETMQHHFIPLPPTETGRRRHAAHQLKAPKFTQNVVSSKQSQHTEMYFG